MKDKLAVKAILEHCVNLFVMGSISCENKVATA